MSRRPSCQRCAGLGYINPAPYTKLYNCPDCQRKPELPNYQAREKPDFTEEQKTAFAKAIFDNDYSDIESLKSSGRWLKPRDETTKGK